MTTPPSYCLLIHTLLTYWRKLLAYEKLVLLREGMALGYILGLLTSFFRAVLQGVKLRLEVFKQGGVGALMEALQFVRIALQVVELLFAIVVLDVLVSLSSDPLVGTPSEFLQQDNRAPRRILAAQERSQRAPIGREFYSRQVRDGRSKIGVEGQFLYCRARGNAWSPDEEWHPHRLLIRADLALLQAMFALLPAVVRGKEDVGVLELPSCL